MTICHEAHRPENPAKSPKYETVTKLQVKCQSQPVEKSCRVVAEFEFSPLLVQYAKIGWLTNGACVPSTQSRVRYQAGWQERDTAHPIGGYWSGSFKPKQAMLPSHTSDRMASRQDSYDPGFRSSAMLRSCRDYASILRVNPELPKGDCHLVAGKWSYLVIAQDDSRYTYVNCRVRLWRVKPRM